MRAFIAVVCLIAAVSARSLQKRSDDDGGHWEATWLASEDDVLKSTAEEVKGIKGKLLRDVDGLDNALKKPYERSKHQGRRGDRCRCL